MSNIWEQMKTCAFVLCWSDLVGRVRDMYSPAQRGSGRFSLVWQSLAILSWQKTHVKAIRLLLGSWTRNHLSPALFLNVPYKCCRKWRQRYQEVFIIIPKWNNQIFAKVNCIKNGNPTDFKICQINQSLWTWWIQSRQF